MCRPAHLVEEVDVSVAMTGDAGRVCVEGTVYGTKVSEFCLGHLGAVGRLDSYVVAGNHVQNKFCQTIIYFRQKNIRTKDSLNVQMSVQASLTYLCSFNVCTFGAWLSAFLLVRTQAWMFTIILDRRTKGYL